jgi:pilus assembly protein CpaF
MSLRELLNSEGMKPVAMEERIVRGKADIDNEILVKSEIHLELLKTFDLSSMERLSPEELRTQLAISVAKILDSRHAFLNASQRKNIISDIQNEVMGLGPLEILLADHTISDILVNGCNLVYVERRGKLELTNVRFNSDEHLLRIIDKIVSRVGRRIDESSPMVDARLPDGSRVNAIIAPLALDGPVLSIRRFAAVPLGIDDLVSYKTLSTDMALVLESLVKVKTNLIIAGGTGSGKTTLLNVLSGFIPENERVITIEDAAELRMQQPHVVRLETRPPNIEGQGEINQRALVRNSLRMRPDRIVVGEVRGGEVLDMLQAMNTGHEGSMSTIHANSARDALTRLENMVGISGLNMAVRPLRQQIVSAISVIVQVSRLSDGKRKLVSIHEITGMEGDMISTQEIFNFKQTGVSPDGAVEGRFYATGIRPRFADRLAVRGSPLPDYLFNPDHKQE